MSYEEFAPKKQEFPITVSTSQCVRPCLQYYIDRTISMLQALWVRYGHRRAVIVEDAGKIKPVASSLDPGGVVRDFLNGRCATMPAFDNPEEVKVRVFEYGAYFQPLFFLSCLRSRLGGFNGN